MEWVEQEMARQFGQVIFEGTGEREVTAIYNQPRRETVRRYLVYVPFMGFEAFEEFMKDVRKEFNLDSIQIVYSKRKMTRI